MITVDRVLPLSIGLAVGSLVLGYGLSGWWILISPLAVLGLLWFVAVRWGWIWGASLTLVVFVGVAAAAPWLEVAAGWALLGVVGALSAWDLSQSVGRLERVERIEDRPELERGHLRRLLIVDGLGLGLGGVALAVRIELSFGVALLLAVLAVLGLSQTVSVLRRESD